MKVVTDASPLNYLVLINAEHVLPKLFGRAVKVGGHDPPRDHEHMAGQCTNLRDNLGPG
jgi:hypothetical protein